MDAEIGYAVTSEGTRSQGIERLDAGAKVATPFDRANAEDSEALDSLDGAIELLAGRLAPVLAEDGPANPRESVGPHGSSAIVGIVQARTDRVRRAEADLRALVYRLEI